MIFSSADIFDCEREGLLQSQEEDTVKKAI